MEVDSFLISLTSEGAVQPLSLKRFAEQLTEKRSWHDSSNCLSGSNFLSPRISKSFSLIAFNN